MYDVFSRCADPATGVLKRDDFKKIPFPPCDEFIKRWLFSETLYDDGLDFSAFIDYALALTFPCNFGAGKFVFHVLDSENCSGKMTTWDV